MSNNSVSFKTNIHNALSTLLYDAGTTACTETRDGLAALINGLVRYEEEGTRLYPKIIFTEDLLSLRVLLPQCEVIHIGSGPINAKTYQTCLKKCAPLTGDDWYIFIERCSEKVEYGLMRSGDSALSEAPEQHILAWEPEPGAKPVIIFRQIADGSIEVVTSNGHSLSVTFTGRDLSESDRRPKLAQLYSLICQRTAPEIQPKLQLLLDRIFARTTERGHGTLVIVRENDGFTVDDSIKDANWLREPIDLAGKVQAELDLKDRESSATTRSVIDAVSGMLMSDGITVFDNRGQVLGFNLFVKASDAELAALDSAKIGGARRRAFELLKSRLDATTLACLMVSQDGFTDFGE